MCYPYKSNIKFIQSDYSICKTDILSFMRIKIVIIVYK